MAWTVVAHITDAVPVGVLLERVMHVVAIVVRIGQTVAVGVACARR